MNAARNSLRDLLAFYRDAGVDALVAEEPVDRFADGATAQPSEKSAPEREAAGVGAGSPFARTDVSPDQPQRPKPPIEGEARPRVPAAPATPEAAVMAAREAAKSAKNLDELRGLLQGFAGCTLAATATQLVFADGNPLGRVMFVGEAPGYEEDISGLPFVGRSGKLLDRMMQAIGLDRSGAYIANVVPWRPPGNRTPTPQETAICLPFIRRQIELAGADILVCLGQPATQTLLATREGITKTRGRWFAYDAGGRQIRALPTFHPAFLLRSPLQKRYAWRDFLALRRALAALTPRS